MSSDATQIPTSDAIQIPTSQVVESVGCNQALSPNGHDDEIAHVLFLDVVGFTKLLRAKQRSVLGKLQEIVRGTVDFCAARHDNQLIALPTGDGMALVFLTTRGGSGPAISCAEKIAEALLKYNENASGEDAKIQVRMGIHSGNIVRVSDVNDRPNVAGEGINTAQRVMDCGDIGHILLSDHAFHLRPEVPDRTAQCLSLGKVKVKHDQEVSLYSLSHNEIGNRETPNKIRWQVEESLRFQKIIAAVKKAEKRRQLILVAALGLVVILAAVFWWATRTPPSPPSLAVLPFTPGTQKNSSRAISKGLTEQFVRSFRHLTYIQPKPLSTVRSTITQNIPGQTKPLSPLEAGKKLNVRYVLTGTAESYSNDTNLDNLTDNNADFAVDVKAALYDTEAGAAPVWEKAYPSIPFKELVPLQKTMVKEVTDLMGGTMQEEVDNFELDTKNSSAHLYYMMGRFWSTERPTAENQRLKAEEIAKRAIQNYEEAIKIDPSYARAYAGLADMYVSISGNIKDPTEAKNKALEAAEAAQNFGEGLAEVYASIGTEKWWLERNFATARIAFLLSIKLDDQFSDSHKRYSSCLAALGKHKEAKEQIDRALRMEPESTIIQLTSAQNHYFARDYGPAIDQLRKIVSNNPNMSAAHRFLALTLEQKNLNQEALEELKKGEGENKDDSDFLGARGHILAHMGQTDEALKIAQSLEKLKTENKRYVSPYNIAVIYAELPNKEGDALRWLDRAIREFDPRVTWLKVDPRFTQLGKSRESEFKERLLAAGLLP